MENQANLLSTGRNALLVSQNLVLEATHEQLCRHASIREAEKHRLENALTRETESSREYFPVCSTDVRTFSEGNIGLELYFLFLKQLMTLFSILALMSILAALLECNKQLQPQSWKQRQCVSSIVIDLASTTIFLCAIPLFTIQANRRIRQRLQRSKTVSQFTVKVTGLPGDVNTQELREFFSRYGSVREVVLGRNYGNTLYKTKHLNELARKLIKRKGILEAKGESLQGDEKLEKYTKAIVDAEADFQRNTEIKHYEQLSVGGAYIVFDLQSSRNHCLKAQWPRLCLGTPRCCFLRNRYRLSVSKAPQPDNILWENQNLPRCVRYSRLLASLLLLFCILCFSLIILIFLEKPGKEKSLFGGLAINSPESSEDIARSAAILVSDLILGWIVNWLSKKERPISVSRQANYKFVKLFLVQFINSVLLFVLLHYLKTSLWKLSVTCGNVNVGHLISQTSFLAIFIPHLLTLLVQWPYHVLKRRCFQKQCLTQYELNRLYLGTEFEMPDRLAAVLIMASISFIYSAYTPVTPACCLIGLVVVYWTDKTLLLQYHRRPPFYSGSLCLAALHVLYLAVACHSAFNMYFERNGQIQKIGYAILLAMSLIFFIVGVLVNFAYSLYLKRNQPSSDEKSYNECISNREFSGLTSYDARDNPNYAFLISFLNNYARGIPYY